MAVELPDKMDELLGLIDEHGADKVAFFVNDENLGSLEIRNVEFVDGEIQVIMGEV